MNGADVDLNDVDPDIARPELTPDADVAVAPATSTPPTRPGLVRIVAFGALALAGLGLVYLLFSIFQVYQAGREHDADGADAIVVLGAAQYDGRPSPQLEARLDHVITLYDDGIAPVVVVTGGNQPGDRFTEAEASRRYLVEAGVPDAAILGEDEGSTTYESLDNVAGVLVVATGEERPDVVLVTDPYHAKRSELTAGEVGLDADASATPDSVVRGWSSVRRHVVEGAGVAVGRLIGFDALSDLTD